jgi:tetratricopeptide (TPR) repeat protein
MAQNLNATGPRRTADILALALSAVVVLTAYGIIACTAESELGSRTAGEAYYNRLVDGFTQGHLWLDLAPPAGLVNLPDPYDPKANAPFHRQMYEPGRIHDLSYYRGRLYLYFSVVPAVVLFLPFHWLTGAYVSHQGACFLFCGVGFLAGAALVDSIRRHCFPRAGPLAAAVATLCVGLVPLVPVVLQRPDVWEVAITASYAFWMLSLLLVWEGLRRPDPSWAVLLGTGMAVGLAIGCRPNEFLGAAILLLPLRRCLGRDRAKGVTVAATLITPLAVIGAGLLAYNYNRFGSIFEFGQRYQLSQEGEAESVVRHFDPGFLWYNFRLYFLEYPGWHPVFPFVRNAPHPPMPAGHGIVENPIGVLTLLPFILCAAAVPWGRRQLEAGPRRSLTEIIGAILVLFLSGAGPVCLYFTTCVRYQLEFVPALVLLAAIGFLAIASASEPGRPLLQALLGAAGCAAVASIAFNLLTAANLRGDADAWHGIILMRSGQYDQAIEWYRRSRRLQSDNVFAQLGMADSLEREGKFTEASIEFQRAIVLLPSSPEQHLNYAYCLYRLNRWNEAIAECEAALKLRPDFTPARNAEAQIRRAQGSAP